MRHNKQGRKLKRTASHRKALLSALSTALIKHKRIRTTTAKAKETRRIIEPIITRARDAYLSEKIGNPVDVHARREVYRFIRDREAISILFSEIAEKVGRRPGGYTRVLALGNRLGDGAAMSVIELVDYNEAQDTKHRRDRVARSKAAASRRKAAEERKSTAAAGSPAAAAAVDTASAETDELVSDAPVAAAPETDAPVQDAQTTELSGTDAADSGQAAADGDEQDAPKA